MCSNGINTGQFEQMIDQIDDHIKLQELLDEVRALLADAKDELEEEAASAPGVTVSLV